MEWIATYFLLEDETFLLTLWALFLVSATLLLVARSQKSSRINITTPVPLMHEAFLPTIISKPNSPVTYVACKKCGNHAIKTEHSIVCLSASCRHYKK